MRFAETRGFMLADVVAASAILALSVGSVAAVLSADRASRARTNARNSVVRCIDAGLVGLAVGAQEFEPECANELRPLISN